MIHKHTSTLLNVLLAAVFCFAQGAFAAGPISTLEVSTTGELSTTSAHDYHHHYYKAEIQRLRAETTEALLSGQTSPLLEDAVQQYEQEILKDQKSNQLTSEQRLERFLNALDELDRQFNS